MEAILDTIGNTPTVRLRRCAPPNGAGLWMKLERAAASLRGRIGPQASAQLYGARCTDGGSTATAFAASGVASTASRIATGSG